MRPPGSARVTGRPAASAGSRKARGKPPSPSCSDGSIESVTFVVSSGVAEVDDAIRRIIESQTPYRAFPAGLASEYDVIEIRRTWYFDNAVRLY